MNQGVETGILLFGRGTTAALPPAPTGPPEGADSPSPTYREVADQLQAERRPPPEPAAEPADEESAAVEESPPRQAEDEAAVDMSNRPEAATVAEGAAGLIAPVENQPLPSPLTGPTPGAEAILSDGAAQALPMQSAEGQTEPTSGQPPPPAPTSASSQVETPDQPGAWLAPARTQAGTVEEAIVQGADPLPSPAARGAASGLPATEAKVPAKLEDAIPAATSSGAQREPAAAGDFSSAGREAQAQTAWTPGPGATGSNGPATGPAATPDAASFTADLAEALDRIDEAHQQQIDRIARTLSVSVRQGVHQVRLQLHPPELGALRVHLAMQGDQLTANLEVTDQAARRMLLANLPTLERHLADQGIEVRQFQVQMARDPAEAAWQGPGGEGRSSGQGQREAWFGQTPDADAAEEPSEVPEWAAAPAWAAQEGRLNLVA